jgi:hypothetical protein
VSWKGNFATAWKDYTEGINVGRTLDLRCARCSAVFGRVFSEAGALWAFLAAHHVPTQIGGKRFARELRGARDRAKQAGASADLTVAYGGTSTGVQRLAGQVSTLCPNCGPLRLNPQEVATAWRDQREFMILRNHEAQR